MIYNPTEHHAIKIVEADIKLSNEHPEPAEERMLAREPKLSLNYIIELSEHLPFKLPSIADERLLKRSISSNELESNCLTDILECRGDTLWRHYYYGSYEPEVLNSQFMRCRLLFV